MAETTTEFIRRLVGAWDCCGTCAGGVLARRDAERDAAARAEDAARLAEVERLVETGELEVASLIRRAALIQPFGPNSRAVHDSGGAVCLTPAEAEAGARAVLTRFRAALGVTAPTASEAGA